MRTLQLAAVRAVNELEAISQVIADILRTMVSWKLTSVLRNCPLQSAWSFQRRPESLMQKENNRSDRKRSSKTPRCSGTYAMIHSSYFLLICPE